MGIGGITYTDGRGRRKSIDATSLDDFKSRLQSLSPRQRATPPLPQPVGQPERPQSPPDVMPGAGVVNTRNGLALRGEENNPVVVGKKVYGCVDGRKGWHSLDELDPSVGGRRVGRGAASDNEVDALAPDGDEVQGFDGTPINVPYVSRVVLTGGVDGVYELTAFERLTLYSSGRRAGGVTKETAVPVGTIYVSGGGGGAAPGSKFHFAYKHEESTAEGASTPTHTVTIGEGAVQLGGFTHFVAGGSVSYMSDGTQWICCVVNLSAGTASFVAYPNTGALNLEQLDVTKYVFPLYKVVDYEVVLDYRPMPNAGVWEDETLISAAP